MLSMGQLSAAVTLANPLGCDPGRNAGREQPNFWTREIRDAVVANLDAFPEQIDVPFLGAWIENESGGRKGVESSLGEVGLFQVHPAELEALYGASKVSSAQAAIRTNLRADVRAGGDLLNHYDEAIVRFGIPRGSELYHALLKVMHSSRPRGIRWLQHVTSALGRAPRSYNEFLVTTKRLADRQITSSFPKAIPDKLPSCAAGNLLERRDTFLIPGEPRAFPRDRRLGMMARGIQYMNSAGAVAMLTLMGPIDFPGVTFAAPLPFEHTLVTSGWGQPRPARDGTHEGLDMPAPRGTPVLAVADGTVAQISTGEFAGLFVALKHAAGWTTRYLHLDQAFVRLGETVRAGQRIGAVGTSGTKASAPHLHFDMQLETALLPGYVQLFGEPRGGFGSRRAQGTTVPAEPLIPVRGYQADVIRDAAANRIPLFTKPAFPIAKVFVGVAAVAFVGMLGASLYQRRRI
jgi:murein DD-endopeptidase MepM/ murein hydrolase activator NlpD